jgi:hypothetical protein
MTVKSESMTYSSMVDSLGERLSLVKSAPSYKQLFRNEKPIAKVKNEREEIIKKIVLMELQSRYHGFISKFQVPLINEIGRILRIPAT